MANLTKFSSIIFATALAFTSRTFADDITASTIKTLNQIAKNNPLEASTLKNMIAYEENERKAVYDQKHATRIRLQTNSKGELIENRPVVVLVHGLFDSPAKMEALENYAYAKGASVISVRLPGHHEKDPTNIERVRASQWSQSVQQSLEWASKFSKSVTLVGHSAGGLLAMQAAAENVGKSTQVTNLVLLAPALKLNFENTALAAVVPTNAIQLTDFFTHVSIKKDEEYQSSAAGRELMKLETEVSRQPLANKRPSQAPFARQIDLLKNTNVTWFDTESDDTLDINANTDTANAIAQEKGHITHVIFKRNAKVAHEDLTQFTNTEKEKITYYLDRALKYQIPSTNSVARPNRAISSTY